MKMKKHSKLLPLCLAALTLPGMASASPAVLGVDSKISAESQQQKGRVVTGTITDAVDGTTIIGANILLKGTTTGVISDIDGHFSIPVNSSRDVLVVSYIGYKTREVPVEDLGVINIKLSSDNEVLDEVVIVGSGTQKKISVTGSISSVKGSSLKVPSSSLTAGLAGRLAGVMVNTTSGEPGSASSFYIRGISTFGGRTEPLIMLDDVEIDATDLNNIPAETIESFSILKDASATAIYGSRGANGVMLITTKNGVENSKTKINVTLENSFQSPMNFPEFVDGATWMEMYNEGLTTRGTAGDLYTPLEIENTRKGVNPYIYPDVDWRDLLFKNMAMSQRANINVQGGGSRVTYYISLNVNHDSGLLDSPKMYSWDSNINNMAYNFQSNIGVKVTPTTKLRLNMNAQIRNKKGPNNSTASIFQQTLYTNPVLFPAMFPAEEGDSHVRFGNAIFSNTTLYTNPLANMVNNFKEEDVNAVNTTLRIEQDLKFLTKGLSVNALINFKNYSRMNYNRSIKPFYYGVEPGSYDPANPTDFTTYRLNTDGSDYMVTSGPYRSGNRTITLQFQANYQRQFGLHNVGGMLMYMQRDYRDNIYPQRNQGLSGRFTYDYGQRYLAEVNFGYNGSDRLAREDRFEFFPAISLGWVVSNEEFFKPLTSVVDNFKLRGSYGLVGSDGANYTPAGGSENFRYFYLDKVVLDSDRQGFTTGDEYQVTYKGPLVQMFAVQNACWEHAKKLDIGVDLTLFRNWTMVFDYFYEKRYDILMRRASWPNSLGYKDAVPWSNIGRVNNWGYEFSTTYTQNIGKDLTLDFRGNFSYNENEYEYKDEGYKEYPWQVETGRPLSTMYGYIAEGLFTSEDEIASHARQDLGSDPMVGDIKYRDLNGDGIINDFDQAYISEYGGTPRIQYGFGLTLKWKKFDLGVFFNGSAMRKIWMGDIHPFGQNKYNVFQFIADDYWSESNPNPNAKYPRLAADKEMNKNNRVNSTYWLRNGNFLRFKQLEIGYTFKYGRIYLTGDNLAVFSPFKEWEPELSWNSYPLQRTFNIGLQLNL